MAPMISLYSASAAYRSGPSAGRDRGRVNSRPPGGGAVAANGDLYVADFYNHRVQCLRPDGAFLTAFGDKGEGLGRLTYAMGVAVAADGSVFVTDFGNHRITKWRPGKTGG